MVNCWFLLQVKFHYVTRTVDEGQKIIDDSRKHKEPMEIIVGKKFKFEPWEECLKSMTCGEISSFTIDEKVNICNTVNMCISCAHALFFAIETIVM